jgi:hypothetical protein
VGWDDRGRGGTYRYGITLREADHGEAIYQHFQRLALQLPYRVLESQITGTRWKLTQTRKCDVNDKVVAL